MWRNINNLMVTRPFQEILVFLCPRCTIQTISPWHCSKSGRKTKIDVRLQRRIVRMVDKQPRATSKHIVAVLQAQGVSLSTRTIRRCLNEQKCYGRRPRRTPLLTQRHKQARLQFTKMYVSKPKSFWENVLWTYFW